MRTLAFALALVAAPGVAQEAKLALKDAPGRDKAQACVACHSIDYIQMNSRFLDKAGWTASVNKMINVFGASIPKEDVDIIAEYLAAHYGKPAPGK